MAVYKKNARAQSSIEFIVLVMAVLFFFILLLAILQQNISEKNNEDKNKIVKDLAYAVQQEISLAHESSDGYKREFFLPEKIVGVGYNASLMQGYVYIVTDDNLSAIAMPVKNVTGNLVIGKNIITKKQGRVYLNG